MLTRLSAVLNATSAENFKGPDIPATAFVTPGSYIDKLDGFTCRRVDDSQYMRD